MTCFLRTLRRLMPLLLLVAALPADAERLALVIGNASYADGPLKNPVNDARAIARRLGALGFAVTKVENLKRDDIGGTVEGFAATIRPGDDVVVYYAGHGVQVKGTNYFPAVDARIQRETDVPLHSLNLNDLLDLLDQAKAGVKVVLLDACRNNPYARSFRDGSRGLARITNAPSGTLIHYATRPGQVAADGDGANGLYTSQLLKAMDTPGLVVELLFKQVASEVKRVSKGVQEPWVEGHLDGSFYFNPGGAPAKDAPRSAAATPSGPSGSDGADFGDLEQAQQQTVEARRRWEARQRAMQAAFDKAATLTATLEIETKAWERFLASYAEDNPDSVDDDRLRAEAGRRLAAAQARRLAPRAGSRFRDCDGCPAMTVLPGGTFEMGSGDREGEADERPVHRVDVAPFALGVYEVTQREWRALTGAAPSGFQACGGDCPVEKVNWDDVLAFIRALNRKVAGRDDGPYRLPSEAEWEFACRAGGRHAHCGGDDPAAVAWFSGNSDGRTHPVGRRAPNAFGLHDMNGNVWEWTADCWHNSYRGAPAAGTAWTMTGGCSQRVIRGGGWFDEAAFTRAARRFKIDAAARSYVIGVRVAKTIP